MPKLLNTNAKVYVISSKWATTCKSTALIECTLQFLLCNDWEGRGRGG